MIQKGILKFLNISKIGINKKKVITLNNDIKTNFIKRFPILKGDSNNPYIILFDAYTGMGKSTVSRLISKYNNAIILNNDEVRNFLNDYNNQSNLKDKLQKYRLEKFMLSCFLFFNLSSTILSGHSNFMIKILYPNCLKYSNLVS